MPTEIPVRTLSRDGFATEDAWSLDVWTVADGSGQLYIENNDGNIWIEFHCADAQLPTVSVDKTLVVGGEALPDHEVVATASGKVHKAGPWPPAVYNREDGSVALTVTTAGVPGNVHFRAFGI